MRPTAQFLVLAPLLAWIVLLAPRAPGLGDAGGGGARVSSAAVLRPPPSMLTTTGSWLSGAPAPDAAGPSEPARTPPAAVSAAGGGSGVPQRALEDRQLSSTEEDGAEEETQESPPIFYEHEVQEGDTVIGIAVRYGISSDYIVWNNVDILDDADELTIGAILQVPSVEGMIHSVRVGETVSGIAEMYDAAIADIVAFEANGFAGNPDNLPEGSLILVPGGRPVPVEPPPVESTPEPEAEAEPPDSEEPGPETEPSPEVETPVEPEPQAPAAPGWLWPATGRITNYLSAKHPLGIDISMVVGTPIVAASAGQAVFVGGNPCCSYGSHVIVEHADGFETLYAHLSSFAVSNGEWVAAGQVIGWSGSTGRSTGPHLHFEIRKQGAYLNPMHYLP